jgi:hypothetical protein
MHRNNLVADLPDTRRRGFVRLAAAVFGAGILDRFGTWPNVDVARTPALAVRIARILGLTQFIVSGADAPLVAKDANQLIDELLGMNAREAMSLSDDELREHLRRRITADFESGALHNVDGWLLSNTESTALDLATYVNRTNA